MDIISDKMSDKMLPLLQIPYYGYWAGCHNGNEGDAKYHSVRRIVSVFGCKINISLPCSSITTVCPAVVKTTNLFLQNVVLHAFNGCCIIVYIDRDAFALLPEDAWRLRWRVTLESSDDDQNLLSLSTKHRPLWCSPCKNFVLMCSLPNRRLSSCKWMIISSNTPKSTVAS